MDGEPRIVVDGYNLMHQIVDSRLLGAPRGLERARARVIHRVRQMVPLATHRDTAIVFDASSGEGRQGDAGTGPESGEVRVLFALEYPDADSMIEEIIRRHSSPARLTVVSSDRRLMDAARRRGASGIDCQTWLDQQEELAEKKALDTQEGNPSGPVDDRIPGSDERDYWMKEFGFGPEE